jgi:hypothetical protein
MIAPLLCAVAVAAAIAAASLPASALAGTGGPGGLRSASARSVHGTLGAPAIFRSASAGAGVPKVTLFTAIPATVPASGGTVRLVADVQNALTCRFSSTAGAAQLPARHDCASGAASAEVEIAGNASASVRTYSFELSASGLRGTRTTAPVVVRVQAGKRQRTSVRAPAVTSEPRSATVTVGRTATFSATASGTPAPTVQWQRLSYGASSWQRIAGARATTYSFTATAADGGEKLRAVFTNTVGSATTSAATLTATSPRPSGTAPQITAEPASESVLSGATAGFVAAASGTPTPTVQWQVSTSGGRSWSNIAGASSTSYAFIASTNEAGFEYRAVFTNSAGSATTSAAMLTVTPPPTNGLAPVVTTEPVSESVLSGATASFSAAASGTPTPSVQWQVSTNGGSVWSGVAGATSASFAFTATTGETGFEYRAVFTNSAGSATTAPATLTVTTSPASAPTITLQPVSQTVAAGGPATFTAAASGTPAPTVQWQVSTNGGGAWGNVAGASSTTYDFAAGSSQNGYEYRAVFTNSVSSATTNGAMLTVVSDATSENWSGYFATGKTFSAVSGSWTVPTVTCPAGATAYSSHWIGIDGAGSDTVEQDGTEADCFDGSPYYGAWWEMYGDDSPSVDYGYEVPLATSSYPVAPGDTMTASVSVSGGTWTLAIADTTKHWTFSTNVAWSAPEQASAEWIVERPDVCSSTCGLANLSDFGSVSFTGATATASGTTGSISAFSFEPIEMLGSTVLAAPGGLSGGGESFTDTWHAGS